MVTVSFKKTDINEMDFKKWSCEQYFLRKKKLN